MGGGDLNLKKSWHPSTLCNMEQVWKAEQKHEAEKKKIKQLQRELAEERAQEEMRNFAENQGPSALVDKEEYLMGRSVDKTFEVIQQLETGEAKNTPDESYLGNLLKQASTASNISVDMANKIREDPLFQIRKQEQEKKKLLVSNPIKMKQLHQLLQHSTQHSVNGNSHKKKKKKKRSRRSSSSEPEVQHKKKATTSPPPSHRHRSPDNHRKRAHSSSDEGSEDERSARERKVGLIVTSKSSSRPVVDPRKNPYQARGKPQKEPTPDRRGSKKSAEEMEKLREQMLADHKWREEQRAAQVSKYRQQDEEEDRKNRKTKEAKFITPLLNKAVESSSVEGRIKQNMFKIQRIGRAMENNFARR
ncbi:CWC25 [Cordylochernes scorpioides]|uniref:CWC25 n=1 Tax=Cordylochernes scorpioides TaxID=51811 RepID=A0ABY6LPU2_9ARAC|nr:CWC25 [Cordylochernes scorpioides]